jgi:hypothetical protein
LPFLVFLLLQVGILYRILAQAGGYPDRRS